MWMIKVFFRFNTNIFYSYCQFHLKSEGNLDLHTCVYLLCVHMTKNTYMYKIHIYANAKIHLVWAGVYLHGGVYLHMCKLTFTYMQLRSHAQKYTRVQIIHICIIYTPCVNQRMWTGLKRKVRKTVYSSIVSYKRAKLPQKLTHIDDTRTWSVVK